MQIHTLLKIIFQSENDADVSKLNKRLKKMNMYKVLSN